MTEIQADINSVIATVVAISLAVNGYFLRSVARRIELMDERQRKHADRLTWLEAHADTAFPHKRADDPHPQYHRRNNDKPVGE